MKTNYFSLKKTILSFIFLIVCCLLLVGCNNQTTNKLEIPQSIFIDEYEILKWEKVENANGYCIHIEFPNSNEMEYYVDSNEFDTFELFNIEGNYNIKIYAYNEVDGYLDSSFSETLVYNIPSQTDKMKFELINNNSGYRLVITEDSGIKGKVIIPTTYLEKEIRELVFDYLGENEITGLLMCDTITNIDVKKDNFSNIRRIKLSDNITKIYPLVFTGCKYLKEIVFPENLASLSAENINDCPLLKKIYLGNKINKIGKGFISWCDNIEEIVINENNHIFDSDGNCIIREDSLNVIFMNCNSVIPNYVNKIEGKAFYGSERIEELIIKPGYEYSEGSYDSLPNLKKVTFEEGIDYISYFINNCENLEEIEIPSSLETIGDYFPYKLPGLKRIVINGHSDNYETTINGSLIDKRTKELIFLSPYEEIPQEIKIIGKYSCMNTNLEEIIIPKDVEVIDVEAFSGNRVVRKIVCGNELKEIKAGAFAKCNNLREIIFNDKLESIGRGHLGVVQI